MNKINLKSEKGFTLQDLIAAIIIFTIFVGTIGSLISTVVKMQLKTQMTAGATNYAIMILEDIDKRPYNQITSDLASSYSMPQGFNLRIDITNHTGWTDLIKFVKITISHDLFGEHEELVINRLKINEI